MEREKEKWYFTGEDEERGIKEYLCGWQLEDRRRG